MDLITGAVAQPEVAERHLARLARSSGRGPGGLQLLDRRGEPVGRRATQHPAGMLRRPVECGIGAATNDDFRSLVARLRTDAAGEADLLTAPEAAHLVELALEGGAAGVEVDPAGVVVVLAPAD